LQANYFMVGWPTRIKTSWSTSQCTDKEQLGQTNYVALIPV